MIKKNSIKSLTLLSFILILGFILRFYQLTILPPALDWDEASTAYNGYSILKTGRDEFGQRLPFLFRAFDGYVPPLLIYLNVLSIFVFGLNEFAARFPNAFLGSLTVLGVYLLVNQTTKEKKLALLSALFLAISPWHIIYSRVNFFASLPVFFLVFGTYFFFIHFSKKIYLLFSLIFFVFAVFSYFSAYIFAPLLSLFLVIVFRRKMNLKKAMFFILPIILSSFLILFLLPGGQSRLKGIAVFSDSDLLKISANEAIGEGLMGKIIHNRRLIYLQKILEGYFVNFRFDFLFGKNDNINRMIVPGSGFGLLYLWDLPFLLYGIYILFAKKPPYWQLFSGWLILSPIAASPTLFQPASTRATVMMPVVQIITAFGFWNCFKSRPKILTKFFIVFLFFNFFIFTHQYFTHFAYNKSQDWFYGYQQLFNFLNTKENFSKQVYFIFRQQDALDQSHIFALFYNQINPAKYQQNGGTKLDCFGTTGNFSFERYHFIPYDCLEKPVELSFPANQEFIVAAKQIENKETFSRVNFLDGTDAFYIYKIEKIPDTLYFSHNEKVYLKAEKN